MANVAWNFAYKLLGEGTLRFFAAFFILLLARKIGVQEFGRFSSAAAFASIVAVIVDLGLNSVASREIAKGLHSRDKLFGTAHILKLLGVAVCLLFLFASFYLPVTSSYRDILFPIGIITIGYSLSDYFGALFTGADRMREEAYIRSSIRLLSLSGGFVAMFMKCSFHTIVWAAAMTTLIGIGTGFLLTNKMLYTGKPRWDKALARDYVRSALPIFFSVGLWFLYDSQDILLLTYFGIDSHQIGFYAAANKIVDVVKAYPLLLAGAFFPGLARLAHSAQDAFTRKTRKLLATLVLGLVPIGGVLYGGSGLIIRMLYGSAFLPATMFFRAMLPGFLLICVNHVLFSVLLTLRRERHLFYASLLVCFCNLVAGVALIPRIGAMGGCYALIISEAVGLAYLIFIVGPLLSLKETSS